MEKQNQKLLAAAIKLNTMLLAAVFACVFGLSLFAITYLSLLRGLPHPGRYLNLLGVFLPGYEVNPAGAWIGLFWGAALGAFFAIALYRVYARSLNTQIPAFLKGDAQTAQLMSATLYLDGKSLGLAAGAVAACGLIASTNWLVIRGTADQSIHAMLLVNYLPGYAINLTGSIVGALELFALAYLLAMLFSKIYNRVAASRSGMPQ